VSGRRSAEQIRRREISRLLERLDLSQEEEDVLDRMSCSLVAKLFLGPIPGALAGAGVRASNRNPEAEGPGPTGEQLLEGKHVSRSL
jgi:glutamyl-tRNAGlu reductase-like protein